jgi:TolA-binding protein
MATEVKQPTDSSTSQRPAGDPVQQFWNKYGKFLSFGLLAIVLVVGGYFAYINYIKGPNEKKAAEAMWRAEQYFRMDSVRLALNGDGANFGFTKVISKFPGTKAAELAKFYAASCYMRLADFNSAVKHLKDYSGPDELVNVRATGLLGDAYLELGKKAEAVDQYKKAGTMFPDDNFNSPEYLFRAGLLYQDLGKNKEAIEMYQIIRQRYPASQHGRDIEKYLARLGSVR